MTSRDVRRYPLFWTTDREFERVDEWSFPKAFAFGDMDILEEENLECISTNYFRCAVILVRQILDNEIEDFVAQLPIIYLFRHAFELRLKHIIIRNTARKPKNLHSLRELAMKVDGLDDWARKRIQELDAIDPKSTSLRYGGVGKNAGEFLGTDARFFLDAMQELSNYLTTFPISPLAHGKVDMTKLEHYYRSRVSPAAYDLFAVFARFEYAMKKGGYRRKVHAEAAWPTFANDLPPDFYRRMRAAQEAQIYFDFPPDHLVADDGSGVCWSGTPRVPTNAHELFESIKTARNNLFHGDKPHNSRRDHDLMIAALFILNAAYESAEHDPKFAAFITEMKYGL